jgi:signal transduction histidine kinase
MVDWEPPAGVTPARASSAEDDGDRLPGPSRLAAASSYLPLDEPHGFFATTGGGEAPASEGPDAGQARTMEIVGQMTTGIVHDFNNQIQAILSSLAAMERRIARAETSDIPRLVGFALKSARVAETLSRRLLEFTAPRPASVRPVAINAIIASLSDLLRWAAGPGVKMALALGDVTEATSCDPHLFENALLNLVINARHAMPRGGSLRIETCHADLVTNVPGLPHGRYVRICVIDDGCGMAPDVVARAFEPFYTTKPIGEGTGMGLAMIKAFAQQCGGYADIRSSVGKGTVVSLYLPCGAPAVF